MPGAVAGSRNLALAGVESFEGIIDKASPKRPSGRWTICSPKCGAVVAGLDAAGYFSDTEPLQDALEVWGAGLALSEPGLALLGFGKRDVPYDLGLPAPRLVMRGDGSVRPLDGAASVFAFNDQHACMDTWRLIPVVDDEYRVIDAVPTYF